MPRGYLHADLFLIVGAECRFYKLLCRVAAKLENSLELSGLPDDDFQVYVAQLDMWTEDFSDLVQLTKNNLEMLIDKYMLL